MRSAMISLDRMVGWFPHTPVEWIELITNLGWEHAG